MHTPLRSRARVPPTLRANGERDARFFGQGMAREHPSIVLMQRCDSILVRAFRRQLVLAAVALLPALAAGALGCSSNSAADTPSDGGASGAVASGDSDLDQACTAVCATQSALACAASPCHATCLANASVTASVTTSCKAEYEAMMQCASSLAAAKWQCSSDENVPELSDGQCTASVCAWTCCVTDLHAPSDLWARCNDCGQ